MTKDWVIFLGEISFCAGSDSWRGEAERYGRRDHYEIPRTGRPTALFSYKYSLLSGVFQYTSQKRRCAVKI
jgi:hypothetical protein